MRAQLLLKLSFIFDIHKYYGVCKYLHFKTIELIIVNNPIVCKLLNVIIYNIISQRV